MATGAPTVRPGRHHSGALFRSAGKGLAIVALLSLACNVGALAVPIFNMQVFTRVLPTRDIGTLGALSIGLAIGLLTLTVLEYLRSAALELLGARIASRAAPALVAAAAAAPRPDLAVGTALADLETLRAFLAGRACTAPFDIAWAPILIVALLGMHWALGLLGLLCVALMLLLNWLGEVLSRSAMLAANEATVQSMRTVADGIDAAEAIVGLRILPQLGRRWAQTQWEVSRLVHRALLRARAVTAVSSALRAGMTGAMVALGLGLALSGSATSGAMVGGNMVLARLLLPFGSIAATRRQWADARAAWRRLRIQVEEPVALRNGAFLPVPAARLAVEALSYVPPGTDRVILRSIGFVVEPGEAIALVGPSSSGKSTLLRAIMGILQPTSGGAYLDGGNTFLWNRADFARHVGYLPQRPTLLEESLADNVAAMAEPDLSRVIDAVRRVGLHETVAALPDGYATILAPHILSGGQRQRLALARALYGGCKLLVLDEPSAFLDPASEAALLETLATLKRDGMTILFATHRPALLAIADRVIVMADGAVAQIGPARDLRSQLVPRVRLVSSREQAVA